MTNITETLDLDHPVEEVFGQVLAILRQRMVVESSTGLWHLHEAIVKAVATVARADGDGTAPRREPSRTFVYDERSKTFLDRVEAFLHEGIVTFRERSRKYAGSTETWDATFVRAAKINRCHPAEVADMHVAVKIARREEGDGQDHDDDSMRDSYLDEINYRILAIALRRVHSHWHSLNRESEPTEVSESTEERVLTPIYFGVKEIDDQPFMQLSDVIVATHHAGGNLDFFREQMLALHREATVRFEDERRDR